MAQTRAVAAANIKDRSVGIRAQAGDGPQGLANRVPVGQILKEKNPFEQQVVAVSAFLDNSTRV